MNPDEKRTEIIRYWWTKAVDSLDSAQQELQANKFSFSMNRIYYAAFYAVSAVLLERGARFKKHTGVRTAFHREFIKSGLLSLEWSKFYDRLFEDRQEGDYVALTTFERAYVEDQLVRCVEFHRQIRSFITSF
ncbi:MAG: HEPN domain-containing protein [bacterium]